MYFVGSALGARKYTDPSARKKPRGPQADKTSKEKREDPKRHFGGSGSIRSRMRAVSRITAPEISRLFALTLSTVSCGV